MNESDIDQLTKRVIAGVAPPPASPKDLRLPVQEEIIAKLIPNKPDSKMLLSLLDTEQSRAIGIQDVVHTYTGNLTQEVYNSIKVLEDILETSINGKSGVTTVLLLDSYLAYYRVLLVVAKTMHKKLTEFIDDKASQVFDPSAIENEINAIRCSMEMFHTIDLDKDNVYATALKAQSIKSLEMSRKLRSDPFGSLREDTRPITNGLRKETVVSHEYAMTQVKNVYKLKGKHCNHADILKILALHTDIPADQLEELSVDLLKKLREKTGP